MFFLTRGISSSLLEESLSERSRMTGVFFLDALLRLLYLRYFAFSREAFFSMILNYLDFFLKSFLENLGLPLPLALRVLQSLELWLVFSPWREQYILVERLRRFLPQSLLVLERFFLLGSLSLSEATNFAPAMSLVVSARSQCSKKVSRVDVSGLKP